MQLNMFVCEILSLSFKVCVWFLCWVLLPYSVKSFFFLRLWSGQPYSPSPGLAVICPFFVVVVVSAWLFFSGSFLSVSASFLPEYLLIYLSVCICMHLYFSSLFIVMISVIAATAYTPEHILLGSHLFFFLFFLNQKSNTKLVNVFLIRSEPSCHLLYFW